MKNKLNIALLILCCCAFVVSIFWMLAYEVKHFFDNISRWEDCKANVVPIVVSIVSTKE